MLHQIEAFGPSEGSWGAAAAGAAATGWSRGRSTCWRRGQLTLVASVPRRNLYALDMIDKAPEVSVKPRVQCLCRAVCTLSAPHFEHK